MEDGAEESEYAHESHLMGVETVNSFLATYHIIKRLRRTFPAEYAELDRRIIDNWQIQQLSEAEINRRIKATKDIAAIIGKIYPSGKLVLMGSTVSLCGSFSSDLDLCLAINHGKFGYTPNRRQELNILATIASSLRNTDTYGNCIKKIEVIGATVPILKCEVTDELGDINVDINCNNLAGVYNSYLLHHYARIDYRFPALCIVVKRWAEAANINDPLNGSLNSYAIKLMVLHFLQCGVWPPVLPNLRKLQPARFGGLKYCIGLEEMCLFDTLPQLPFDRKLNDKTPSELLMAFFDYYARFDFHKNEISISHARITPIKERDAMMIIRGPFDFVNVARTVKTDESLKFILDAFKRVAHIYLGPAPKAPLFDEIVQATY